MLSILPEIAEIRLIAPDGEVHSADSIEEAIAYPGSHHVEVNYHYGPDLLPGPADGEGIWRYRRLLPLASGEIRYPLHVGGTPLTRVDAIRAELGLADLRLKDETRGPSLSNKDRATALVLESGLRSGQKVVTCASTGNVASSLAIGAAAAGMRAVICVPRGTSPLKLQLMLAAGADVVEVEEGYTAAFELSRLAAREFSWLDRNTGVNPLTTEAKKTVAFEIWEQLGRTMPDVVVAPIGDGPTIAALAKGFRELVHCGAPGAVPRLIGVQSASLDPLVRRLHGRPALAPGEGSTIAEGIAVPEPVSAAVVLREVQASGGTLLSVPDDDILAAARLLLARAGVAAEPAGASALAGLIKALDTGIVERQARVVCLVTGSALKTPQFLPADRRSVAIHKDLGQLRAVLGSQP
jgi:threonine synthase